MSFMFQSAAEFNQPIGMWNVSKVQWMDRLFCGATAFNEPIGIWNVGNVKDMMAMFFMAESFKSAYQRLGRQQRSNPGSNV
jgi:hypothetical protein